MCCYRPSAHEREVSLIQRLVRPNCCNRNVLELDIQLDSFFAKHSMQRKTCKNCPFFCRYREMSFRNMIASFGPKTSSGMFHTFHVVANCHDFNSTILKKNICCLPFDMFKFSKYELNVQDAP